MYHKLIIRNGRNHPARETLEIPESFEGRRIVGRALNEKAVSFPVDVVLDRGILPTFPSLNMKRTNAFGICLLRGSAGEKTRLLPRTSRRIQGAPILLVSRSRDTWRTTKAAYNFDTNKNIYQTGQSKVHKDGSSN